MNFITAANVQKILKQHKKNFKYYCMSPHYFYFSGFSVLLRCFFHAILRHFVGFGLSFCRFNGLFHR